MRSRAWPGLFTVVSLWNNAALMRFPISALFVVGVLAPGAIAQAQAPAPEPPGLDDRAAAYHAFILGRTLERDDRIDEAIDAYRRAVELDPASSGIWTELAGLYARRNRPDEAIEAGNEALDRNPDDREAHRTLGLVYAARVESREAPAQSDVDLAMDHLAQARNPQAPDVMLAITLGRLYLSTRQPEPAVEVLSDMLDFEPRFADGQVLLARAHEALDQWDEAAAAYERAVLYSPRRARYRRRLANALANAGRADRAIEVLEELVQLRPDDIEGWYRLPPPPPPRLAGLELEAGDFDAAEAAARRVVELEPDELRGAYLLSRALGGKRRYREMAEVLAPVVQRARAGGVDARQVAGLLQQLGFAQQSGGDLDGAAESLGDALELVPSNLGLQAQLVQVYLEAGRLDEAGELVAEVRSSRRDNLALMRLDAQVLSARGSVDDAVSLLEQARARHENEPIAHVALADLYSQHDRVDEAVGVLQAAEERFPDNTLILFQLGAVFERGRRFEEAEGAFRRVLEQDPDDAQALNYLGYMLAERGERLDESVGLIRRALELDPNNGAYLDSLGWAYFKQDELELAESPLRAASDQLPRNSVVQDHMGDLLFRFERYAEAIDAWERALAGDREGVDAAALAAKIRDARARLGSNR